MFKLDDTVRIKKSGIVGTITDISCAGGTTTYVIDTDDGDDEECNGGDPMFSPSQRIWGYETPDGSFAQYAAGTIEDFRIYDTGLTAQQCRALARQMQEAGA